MTLGRTEKMKKLILTFIAVCGCLLLTGCFEATASLIYYKGRTKYNMYLINICFYKLFVIKDV